MVAATVISCVNLKGGVGKTALAVNFAAYCGMKGKKTLLVDLDPQTNATFSCIEVAEWEKHAKTKGTVADLLGARKHASAQGKQKKATQVIRPDIFQNVDLVPSHLDLFTVDLDMAGAMARETRLKKALHEVEDTYQVIICDCPPNLTIPTQNALAASSNYIVPISPDYLSSLGIGILLNRITQLSEDLDTPLTLAGIVMSRVGRDAIHRADIESALRTQFGNTVLGPVLKERVQVAEAAAKQRSIFQMTDRDAIKEFSEVCDQLTTRTGI